MSPSERARSSLDDSQSLEELRQRRRRHGRAGERGERFARPGLAPRHAGQRHGAVRGLEDVLDAPVVRIILETDRLEQRREARREGRALEAPAVLQIDLEAVGQRRQREEPRVEGAFGGHGR